MSTEPTTSLRESIEAALESEENPSAAPAPANQLEPSDQLDLDIPVPGDGAAPAAGADAANADLNKLAEGQNQPDNQQAQQQGRDEQGKFKAKQDEGVQPGPKSGPRQQGEKPPASWRPEVREHWSQLPDTVRSEIARRESEVQRTLQETAEARKTAEAVMRTISPYEAYIKAEGANPLQAIDNLMATAVRLRTGTAPDLANLVAGMVKQFGIGRFGNGFIEMLDSALAGQQPQGDPQQLAVQQVVQQQLAPVQQMLSQFQQAQFAQQQQLAQSAANEVQTFISQAEFGDDVREDMADIMETAQRRGQNITLADAYRKACMMNDQVRSVLQQRQQAGRAQQQTQVAQRARQTAVQVSGAAPVGGLKQDPTDIRSAIEAAIAMNSR